MFPLTVYKLNEVKFEAVTAVLLKLPVVGDVALSWGK
jgi:hypothetical protein